MGKTKFKLKVDARKFFDEKYHEKIMAQQDWEHNCIPLQLLDEVERVYIDYGHDRLNSDKKCASSNLCGWESKQKDSEGQSHYQFTLKIQDISNKEYQKVNVPILMDELQKVANTYFKHL